MDIAKCPQLFATFGAARMPETAAERKKRLSEIRKKAGAGVASKDEAEKKREELEKEEPPAKRPKFRNYAPHDTNLATRGDNTIAETSKRPSDKTDGEEELQDPIKKQLQQAEELEAEGDSAPKKPHYDLKEGIELKLLKLKKRTTRAIVSILRERLAADGDK